MDKKALQAATEALLDFTQVNGSLYQEAPERALVNPTSLARWRIVLQNAIVLALPEESMIFFPDANQAQLAQKTLQDTGSLIKEASHVIHPFGSRHCS